MNNKPSSDEEYKKLIARVRESEERELNVRSQEDIYNDDRRDAAREMVANLGGKG
tara:strand:- start:32 stop:196 length:165 start_codon:yes stop_codon:yes gene_type:complete